MRHVFLDESGIHKNKDHSVFVLVYLEIENKKEVLQQFEAIEKELKIKSFHWSETSWTVKEKFLQKALKLDFKVKLAILKNPIHPEKDMERMLVHMMVERNIDSLIIDGAKPKKYESKIKKILRDKGVSVKKIKIMKDEKSVGLRIADMVAGLARSHYDGGKPEVNKYFRLLENKIIIKLE